MSASSSREALQQAQSLSALFDALRARSELPDMLLWKLGLQHLLISMISFGFRVYSQQVSAAHRAREWASLHQRVVEAVLSEELLLEVDKAGRLIVLDASTTSAPRDIDEDGFKETIVISASDAASIVKDSPDDLYLRIRTAVGDWGLMPTPPPSATGEVLEVIDTSSPPIAPSQHVRSSVQHAAKAIEVAPRPSLDSDATLTTSVSETTTTIYDPTQVGAAGIDLLIGKTVDGFGADTRRLNISDTDLNQLNIGVVGDLGTGKTQLIKSLVYQISDAANANRNVRPRFLIFDYKKDYSADDFVKATGARVIMPRNLPINLFDVSGADESMTPWLDRFRFFADVLDKLYSGIGPVQRNQLKQAVRQAYGECQSVGRQPTIYDIHSKYRATLGTKSDSPLSIIDDLVDMELFSREPAKAGTIDQFLDGVVVIALHALGQDDKTKNMLVAIMLNIFYEHMLRIQKRPYLGTEPQLRVIDSFLLVDEADNIMRYEFDVLRKILLQGREFGVGVILASQYLRHFKAGATDYREPLLTWFIHKVPNITAQELGALGLPAEMLLSHAERIKSLGKHQCLYKTQGIGGDIVRGMPFYEILEAGPSRQSGA